MNYNIDIDEELQRRQQQLNELAKAVDIKPTTQAPTEEPEEISYRNDLRDLQLPYTQPLSKEKSKHFDTLNLLQTDSNNNNHLNNSAQQMVQSDISLDVVSPSYQNSSLYNIVRDNQNYMMKLSQLQIPKNTSQHNSSRDLFSNGQTSSNGNNSDSRTGLSPQRFNGSSQSRTPNGRNSRPNSASQKGLQQNGSFTTTKKQPDSKIYTGNLNNNPLNINGGIVNNNNNSNIRDNNNNNGSSNNNNNNNSNIHSGKENSNNTPKHPPKSRNNSLSNSMTGFFNQTNGDVADMLGMSNQQDVTIRFLKTKMRTLEEEIIAADTKITDQNKQLQEGDQSIKQIQQEYSNIQRLNKNQQLQVEKLQKQTEDQKAVLQHKDKTIASLTSDIANKDKDRKFCESEAKQRDLRLNRALEDVEKQKALLEKLKQQQADFKEQQKEDKTKLLADNRKLERQRRELILAFKKQMKLIDILKKQKTYLEASRMLQISEEEFVRVLEIGSK